MTNLERLRQMSARELASFLVWAETLPDAYSEDGNSSYEYWRTPDGLPWLCLSEEDAIERTEEWLMEEVK